MKNDFTPQINPPDYDRVGIIETDEPTRRNIAGILFDIGHSKPDITNEKYSYFREDIDHDRQSAIVDIARQLAAIMPLVIDGAVAQSSDGLWHLDVTIDPVNPSHYTIELQYNPVQGPPGQNGVSPWQLISHQKLGSAATDITFSSIPQTYKHLRLICRLRSTRASSNDSICIQFNGDTGSNYNNQLNGAAAAAGQYGAAGNTKLPVLRASAGTLAAQSFTGGAIEIPFYNETDAYKTAWGIGVTGLGQYAVAGQGGEWKNTAAITSVRVFPDNGPNFAAGSEIDLIGVQY